ncbi:MAG: hypothetical protein IJU23_14390 [Proteobacteria bacterium]|nr:hypothetical protein [Pseudomonadota bacterium]
MSEQSTETSPQNKTRQKNRDVIPVCIAVIAAILMVALWIHTDKEREEADKAQKESWERAKQYYQQEKRLEQQLNDLQNRK